MSTPSSSLLTPHSSSQSIRPSHQGTVQRRGEAVKEMEWGAGTVASEVLAAAGASARETWGVKDDLDKLQLALSTGNTLMDQAEWWRFSDAGANVVALFTKFKDVRYDAEDLLDAFHYQELIEGMSSSSQVTQAVNWASHFIWKVLSNFMKKFVSGKYNRVKDILENLESVTGQLKEEIEKLDPKRPQIIKRIADIRETSSEITESDPLGREKKKEIVINTLLQLGDHSKSSDEHGHDCSSLPNKRRKKANVSVLPIVGMGGLGKTTLAQMVYNDPRMDTYFQLKLWVCVRDEFDVKKINNKILKSASEKMPELIKYTIPHFKLKKILSKKFLLVLDDVWCEDRPEWEKLYKPLSKENNGSIILVTTRSPKVASIMGTENPITLEGLEEKPFWDFFERCAFISEDPEDYPQLVNIAKNNITKLKGSPLAAKTVGALLSTELNAKHWMNVMDSEMWKVDQGDNGIMPALRLSYQYLTAELRRCFSFCCMFPKDYSFHKSRMVAKWVAHGLIVPQGDGILEERGAKCFDELASRSFFQSSPRYAGMYVIHDLMHDLAQSVSKDECFCIQASDSQQIVPESIRHLSVARHLIEVMKLGKCSKLRTFEVLHPANRFPNEFLSSSNFSFSQLPLVRMLDLRYCGIKILPESLGNMKHLR